MKFRKLVLNMALACLAVFIIGFTAFFFRNRTSKALSEGPLITYPSGTAAQSNVQQFFEVPFSTSPTHEIYPSSSNGIIEHNDKNCSVSQTIGSYVTVEIT